MPSGLTNPLYINCIHATGDPAIPNSIKKLRSASLQTTRRMGVPVLIKHMYNIYDVNQGIAKPSPNQSSTYRQGRHNDPLSYGTGYVSVQSAPEGEWMTTDGKLVISPTDPGNGAVPAPLYRGYGPGYLTYAVLPDAPEDVLKYTEEGALVRTQQSLVQLPWFPKIGDNDLLIVCQLDSQENIIDTYTRYQLKQTTQLTMHGLNRLGRQEYLGPANLQGGNRYCIGNQAMINVMIENDVVYSVETDR